MTVLTEQPLWRELDTLYACLKGHSIKAEAKPQCVVSVSDLTMDYSYVHWNPVAQQLFSELADRLNLSKAIHQLMAGQWCNLSEQRRAWHTVLRCPSQQQPSEVAACYRKIRNYASLLPGGRFTDLIHIGVGGSYLGPRFLYDAFAAIESPRLRCHFIANQDVLAIEQLLKALNPKTTLVLVVSKSWSTLETLHNVAQVLDWLQKALPKQWQDHLIAVTAACQAAQAYGIQSTAIFPLWSWVGGRFSLWSAVSLSIVLSFGWDYFDALLSGAYQMDQHFSAQPWHRNMPVLLAFFGLVYRHFFQSQTQAIIPYHNALTRLVAYLQQLHMESLGKQVTKEGEAIDYPTGAIIWGGTGPGSQHSFHQLLLQGHDIVPVDFITVRENQLAHLNCLAQRKALWEGNRDSNPVSHQCLPGGRPNILLSMPSLSPKALGALLALYEHKIFTQAVLWNINPFDQWGVEAGKQLFTNLSAADPMLNNNKISVRT